MGIEIPVRLNKSQTALIWTGLNHIVLSYAMRERTGQADSSYPFRVRPLPRDFNTGIYSPSMMNRTIALCALLKPKRSSGGLFDLDSFQLRAAAFSARVTLKIQRYLASTKNARKSSLETRRREGIDPKSIERLGLKTKRVIKYLERQMKRAERRFVSSRSRSEFKASSEEWRAHLRWMQFRLAYFTPLPGPGIRKMQRNIIDLLVAMAKKAIAVEGLEVPNDKLVRVIIRRFIHDCHRGRIGYKNFVYMLHRQQSPIAQFELFEYIAPRVGLEKQMGKNRGIATKIAHEEAAAKPKVKSFIDRFVREFEGLTSAERKNR